MKANILPITYVVRVDEKVFAEILREKHLIEGEYTCTVSMNESLRMLLDFDQPTWMDKPRVRG